MSQWEALKAPSSKSFGLKDLRTKEKLHLVTVQVDGQLPVGFLPMGIHPKGYSLFSIYPPDFYPEIFSQKIVRRENSIRRKLDASKSKRVFIRE